MKLSDQALGALMMALQKSLLEQSDIIPVLNNFDFVANENNELFVKNPPLVKFGVDQVEIDESDPPVETDTEE
jgi:hypothetical protein